MKRIKLLVIIMAIVAIGLTGLGSAHAVGWYTCTIDQVGAGQGYNFAWLTEENGAFSRVQFFLGYPPDGSQKELLATALTAKANNQKVYVYLSGTTGGQLCYYMFAQ